MGVCVPGGGPDSAVKNSSSSERGACQREKRGGREEGRWCSANEASFLTFFSEGGGRRK